MDGQHPVRPSPFYSPTDVDVGATFMDQLPQVFFVSLQQVLDIDLGTGGQL